MKILHIKMNEIQEQELRMLMEHEGYTNKSEFFRYLMKFYKLHQGPQMRQAFGINSPTLATIDRASDTDTKPQIEDSQLSERKRKLLNDPHIFDEGVRQLIRDMPD